MAFNISYVYQAIDKFSPVASKVRRSVENVSYAADKTSQKFRTMGQEISTTGAKLMAFATLPLAFLAKNMIKAASSAQEIQSQFEFVFSKISDKAAKSATDLAKSYNFSKREAKELTASIGDFAQNLGFSQEQSLDMSVALNKLAGDVASFKDVQGGARQVSLAFKSALVGEREALKTLGVAILQNDVDAKVKSMRASGKLAKMSLKQANAMATVELLMKNFKSSMGDVARTQDSHANKMRRLAATYDDLSVEIGEKLLPLHIKLMEAALSLLKKFESLTPETQNLIIKLAGVVALGAPLLLIIGGLISAFGMLAKGVVFLLMPIRGLLTAYGLIKFATIALMNPFVRLRILMVGFFVLARAKAILLAVTMKPLIAVWRLFNLVVRANPLGVILTIVGLLISGMIYFRREIGNAINSMLKFFGLQMPDWVKKLFGIDGDVTVKGGDITGKQSFSPTDINKTVESVLNGSITVSAEQGSKVQNVQMSTRGGMNVNLGMSMAGAM